MGKKRINNTEIEEMVVEMIRFLKKWGLWQNTMILACGNSYTDSGNEGDEFRGLTNVVKQGGKDIEFEKAPVGIMKEFNEIFAKHGLYYEPVYNWMITGCVFRKKYPEGRLACIRLEDEEIFLV